MATPRNLSVSVENFGPVREGKVELSPLTIFIGPNNSGKSYMALLVYALSEALLGRFHGRYTRRFWRAEHARGTSNSIEELDRWLYEKLHSSQPIIRFDKLREKRRTMIFKEVNRGLSLVQQEIDEVLRDYFGCATILDLVRKGDGPEALTIRLNGSEGREPLLSVSLDPGKNRPHVQGRFEEPESVSLTMEDPWWRSGHRLGPLDMLWFQLLRENGVARDAYYLPAARSGILQGWQAFASIALQALRQRVGLERVEVPPFTGVAGDFLQVLLERVMQRPAWRREAVSGRVSSVLRVLEDEVFLGEVSLETGSPDRDLILYKSKLMRLPLNRASSMVAELAPLVLWIKYLLEPGDLLIIDEPEAHLHPENQRRVARALVHLVRAGVRVLCTTHSSTILHQVSNHVLASEAGSRTRKELGFCAEDLLDANKVGVYLFDVQEDGTHISPVPVEPGFGIPEDEFVKVSEAIGDETYRLTASLHKR